MSRRDKILLTEVLLTTSLARLIVLFLPFRWTFTWLQRELRGPSVPVDQSEGTESKLSKMVGAVARRIPGATCLTQAISIKMLLNRRHIRSQVRIGIRKDAKGSVEAHAWIENAHRKVIIGGEKPLTGYTPFELRPSAKV